MSDAPATPPPTPPQPAHPDPLVSLRDALAALHADLACALQTLDRPVPSSTSPVPQRGSAAAAPHEPDDSPLDRAARAAAHSGSRSAIAAYLRLRRRQT